MTTETLITIGVILAIIIVTVLLGWAIIKLIDFGISKLHDGPLKDLLISIEDIFKAAITKAYQTEVEALKEAGKFSKEKQKEIKDKVASEIIDKLDANQKAYLETKYDNLEVYVDDHIESVIYDLKQGGKE